MSLAVLFQLTFTFIYSTFRKNVFSFSKISRSQIDPKINLGDITKKEKESEITLKKTKDHIYESEDKIKNSYPKKDDKIKNWHSCTFGAGGYF